MRREAAHLTLVLGEPATAGQLRSALERHGVDHAAVVAHVGSIRRSLVLGENDFVVVCIALDDAMIKQHGEALRSLLSDHQCFPTAVRTVGLLSDLGLTREVAELGCDVYVEDSAQAARAIHLLDDKWAEASGAGQEAPSHARWRIRGGWLFGSPQLPDQLTSLVGAEPDAPGEGDDGTRLRTERPAVDFGDRRPL